MARKIISRTINCSKDRLLKRGQRHVTDEIRKIPLNRQLRDNKGNFPKHSVVRQQLSASLTLTLTLTA